MNYYRKDLEEDQSHSSERDRSSTKKKIQGIENVSFLPHRRVTLYPKKARSPSPSSEFYNRALEEQRQGIKTMFPPRRLQATPFEQQTRGDGFVTIAQREKEFRRAKESIARCERMKPKDKASETLPSGSAFPGSVPTSQL
jgi:hypothetical protein